MALPTPPGPGGPRPHCYRCHKPASMCLCDAVQPVDNRVRVHVLQHHRERRHALGTVRLLRLGLEHIDVHVLPSRGRSVSVDPVPLPEGAALLYPSDDAIELTSLPPDQRPRDLVVIDGTWSHAHRIHRDNDWIQALPHVRLDPEEGSRYRIRTEPRHECLSTVEAVIATLELLEPELEGTAALLAAFDRMIDDQIAARGRGTAHHQRRRPRQREPRAIPDTLGRAESEVVVVFAEAAPDQSSWELDREPIRVSAVTVDGQRVFDAFVVPRTPPDAHLRDKLGLPDGALDAAEALDIVRERLRAFVQPGDTLSAWGPWTRHLLADWFPEADPVLLKGVWANLSQERVPAVPELVRALGLEATELGLAGRAGVRLGAAHAMARHLMARARGDG